MESNDDKLSEKGTAAMKPTTTVQVSVDGVMQGPSGPEEDARGLFERGGWANFDNEAGTVMGEIYQRADAFLFGRLIAHEGVGVINHVGCEIAAVGVQKLDDHHESARTGANNSF
jgi:hypothetical protein